MLQRGGTRLGAVIPTVKWAGSKNIRGGVLTINANPADLTAIPNVIQSAETLFNIALQVSAQWCFNLILHFINKFYYFISRNYNTIYPYY